MCVCIHVYIYMYVCIHNKCMYVFVYVILARTVSDIHQINMYVRIEADADETFSQNIEQ